MSYARDFFRSNLEKAAAMAEVNRITDGGVFSVDEIRETLGFDREDVASSTSSSCPSNMVHYKATNSEDEPFDEEGFTKVCDTFKSDLRKFGVSEITLKVKTE